jgi:hypothetical protein
MVHYSHATLMDMDDEYGRGSDLEDMSWQQQQQQQSSSSMNSSVSGIGASGGGSVGVGKYNRFNQTRSLVPLIRGQLKKELRKLKSSITDSILEEVINYYGKKLEVADVLKSDFEALNKRINVFAQNLNSLGQNFKTISKNHRNLVDIVRNNLITNSKSSNQASGSGNAASNQRNLATNGKPSATAGLVRTSSNVTSLRANENNIKKKSIDSNKLGQSGGDQTANATAGDDKNKLKLELINDLETKYSNLINERLVDLIVKNVNNNSSSSSSSSVDTGRANEFVENVPEKSTRSTSSASAFMRYDDILSSGINLYHFSNKNQEAILTGKLN